MTDTTLDSSLLYDSEAPREAKVPANNSIIERLKAQRAAAVDAPFDIILPDWGAETGGVKIIARMRRIALTGAAERAAAALHHSLILGQPGDRDLVAACDLLIAGLDELYVQEQDDEEARPLDADRPMRFDQRTAQILDLGPLTRARDVVVEVFGGPAGKPKLLAAARAYNLFLSRVEVVTDEEGKG